MPILFIIDPPHSLHLKKDSTFALMKEAIKQNHEVYFCLQHDLYIDANQLFCRTYRFEVNIFPNHAKTYETHPVSFFNALFMRKDPPVDQAYLHTTFLLDIAEKSNVKVFNKPSSIRSWNEKISIITHDKVLFQEVNYNEKKDEYSTIYEPNDFNELVIPIIDHFGLTKIEKGVISKKDAIDKVSEYCQYFRDR